MLPPHVVANVRAIAPRVLALVLAALLFLVVALTPIVVRGQSTEANAHFSAGRFREARAAFTARLATNPRDADAAYYLGRIALAEGDGVESARWLEKAITAAPTVSAYHQYAGRAYGRQALRVGKMKQLSLAKRARASFERAISLDPANIDARADLLAWHITVPGFFGGSRDEARRQASEIARRSAFRGRFAAAAVAEDEENYGKAEREYQAAAAMYPDSLVARYLLGQMYQRSRQYDKAFALFEQLAVEHPTEGTALYHVGRTAALSKKRLDRGAAALTEYLRRPPKEGDPSRASAHFRLANILEQQGNREHAQQHYRETLKLDPAQSEAKAGLKRVGG